MNPLEETPHLFANGEFQVVYGRGEKFEHMYDITGVIDQCLIINDQTGESVGGSVEPRECTLIARPIADMSDEEFEKAEGIKKKVWEHFNGVYIGEFMLYLISIGVYPFDQSHFRDGTVLSTQEVSDG